MKTDTYTCDGLKATGIFSISSFFLTYIFFSFFLASDSKDQAMFGIEHVENEQAVLIRMNGINMYMENAHCS